MDDGGASSPVENARRKAAANAYLNLSKKSSSKMKRVTWLLRKRQEDKRLTDDEQHFLTDNPKLVDQFNIRREKRKEYQLRHIETEDSPQVLREKCSQLAQVLHDSEFLVVYTGAGISTAASIPDYRGPNGIWTRLQKGEDIGSHDLTEAEPTITHMALASLQQCGRLQHIVSQNCDGLHLRSGLPKTALSEVHGNMYIEVCRACVPAREYVRRFDVTERTSTHKHATGRRCYRCGEPLVDSIVHFGERGKLRWPLNWQGACQAANAADTILCIGSSLKVLKKYTWLWQMDRPTRRRPRLYIVNLQWTPKDKEAAIKINGKCDEVMQLVMDYLGMEIPSYNRNEDLIFDMTTALHPDELVTTTRPSLVAPGEELSRDAMSPQQHGGGDGDGGEEEEAEVCCDDQYIDDNCEQDGDVLIQEGILCSEENLRKECKNSEYLIENSFQCSEQILRTEQCNEGDGERVEGLIVDCADAAGQSDVEAEPRCGKGITMCRPINGLTHRVADQLSHGTASGHKSCDIGSVSNVRTNCEYDGVTLNVNSYKSCNCCKEPCINYCKSKSSESSITCTPLSGTFSTGESSDVCCSSKVCSSQKCSISNTFHSLSKENHCSQPGVLQTITEIVGPNKTLLDTQIDTHVTSYSNNDSQVSLSLSSNYNALSESDLVDVPCVVSTAGTVPSCSAQHRCHSRCVLSRVNSLCTKISSSIDGDSAGCKCEQVMRKLFASGATHNLLKCSVCGLFLSFFLKGTCQVSDTAVCTVTPLFCHCLEMEMSGVGVSVSDAPGEGMQPLSVLLGDQQTKLDRLLTLTQVKTEENKDAVKVEIKTDLDNIEKVEFFEKIKEEVKEEDKLKIDTGKFLLSINNVCDTRTEGLPCTENTSHSPNKASAYCDALSLVQHQDQSAYQKPLDCLGSNSKYVEMITDSSCQYSTIDAHNSVSNSGGNFYGTGLCIRSSFGSCNDSSSQDEYEDEEIVELSETEESDAEDGAKDEGLRSDDDSDVVQIDVSESNDLQDSREISSDSCLVKEVSYNETDVLGETCHDTIVSYLCDDSEEISAPSSKQYNVLDLIELASEEILEGNTRRQNCGKEEEVRWKVNGSIRHVSDAELLSNSHFVLGSLGLQNLRQNGQNSQLEKNVFESLMKANISTAQTEPDNVNTNDTSNSSRSQLNGTTETTAASLLNDVASKELQSIWFNSFCGQRSPNGLNNQSGKDIPPPSKVQLASMILGKVKDLVGKKRLLKSVNHSRTDDNNVKKLWFWGFDDASAISHQRSPGSRTASTTNQASLSIEKASVIGITKDLSNDVLSEDGEDSKATNDGEVSSESNVDAVDAMETIASPPRRVTRSRTRTSQNPDLVCAEDGDSKDAEDEDEDECGCGGGLNPALCLKSRALVSDKLPPDDDMLRARAVIGRRRNMNYKKFEPIFVVKLKSLIVKPRKRKSRKRYNESLANNDIKIPKLDWDNSEDINSEEKLEDMQSDIAEEVEKVLKKVTPGWYGKGYRKIIKKKTPKSYPLKF